MSACGGVLSLICRLWGAVCELEQRGQGQRRVGLVRAGAVPLGADGQVSLHPVWV